MKDTPAEQRAKALLHRGVCYGKKGAEDKSIADHTEVIGMKDTPAKQRAIAMFNRGVTYKKKGEVDKAIADFKEVIGIKDAPVGMINNAKAFLKASKSTLSEPQ